MKGFIEVVNSYDEQLLINVNHIIMVSKKQNTAKIKMSYYGHKNPSSIIVNQSYEEVISSIEAAQR